MHRPGLAHLLHQGHQGGLVARGETSVELTLQVAAATGATQGDPGETMVDRPAGDLAGGGGDVRHTDSLHAAAGRRV